MDDENDLNDYERARAALIARNRERMAAMGLLGAANVFEAREAVSEAKATLTLATKRKRPRPRPRHEAPTRTSKRLRGERAPGSEDTTTEEEGEPTPPPPSPPRWTEAELREIRAEEEQRRRAEMDARLSELDIAGLIEYSPGLAHFAIIGAPHKGQKGRKHYRVTFSGGAGKGKARTKKATTTSCECLDFRIRRKRSGGHCKHIRLVLTQLGIDDEEGNGGEVGSKKERGSIDAWEGALERVVMASAERSKGEKKL